MAVSVLIAGLGNPGSKYSWNRHNAGFLTLDRLADRFGPVSWKKNFGGETATIRLPGGDGMVDVALIKPQQYMNRSGESVCPAVKFYKLKPEQLVAVHDEIELSFNDVRMKKGGGHKGHNGLRDIIDRCGSSEFYRIRMGVGRPDHKDVAGHVLADFTVEERSQFDIYLDRGVDEILKVIGMLKIE